MTPAIIDEIRVEIEKNSDITLSDIVLIDNSSVHTSKLVKQTLKECEINHLFLPPYSPGFNPIELLRLV